MKGILTILLTFLALCMAGCESSSSSKKSLPSRETDGGDLPWARPASWEGGLPGMGGLNTNPSSTRY
ncbi:unknown [Coraliomargarita sp. CAG:312]|nr:unknown [Coraliomargarita sp. CAG:312]